MQISEETTEIPICVLRGLRGTKPTFLYAEFTNLVSVASALVFRGTLAARQNLHFCVGNA